MRVLTLNSGSSSLKFSWADLEAASGDLIKPAIHTGIITGIGGDATLSPRGDCAPLRPSKRVVADHGAAVAWVLEELREFEIDAVGHRIVHGGARLTEAVRLDGSVIREIERLTELAPLHNPSALHGIRSAWASLGTDVPMVAIFDTAFHAGLPDEAAYYALPEQLADNYGLRRYGFHGLAHASMVRLCQEAEIGARLITVHLGQGCSMSAVRDGRSVDTSMGFTPLEGLVMATRSGDVDPSVVRYLVKRAGMSVDEVDRLLNEQSGLLGSSGLSGDMQVVISAAQTGHPGAVRALRLFCYRAKKYVGAYLAALGGADAVVFGGGIGERAPAVRAGICAGLEWCGLRIDDALNQAVRDRPPGTCTAISTSDSSIAVVVAGVDEEWELLRGTFECLCKPFDV